MKVLAIIPARYGSTRFPGKPLALIAGRPMIQWVWEGVSHINAITDIIVATDDTRIFDAVQGFGGHAMMTATTHRSGTDRCGEVLDRIDSDADVIVNVQGDEPRVEHSQIELLTSCFENPKVQIATLKKQITTTNDLFSPNVVKVVDNLLGNAIYFSRNPIPFVRGITNEEWLQQHKFYKHIGIYAFRREVLRQVVRLPQSQLETSESLEQLRWLENGYSIAIRETNAENIGVDTPEDLAKLQMGL